MVPDTDFAPAPVASEEQPQTHDPWACLPTLVATANAGGWLIDPREIEMDGVGVGGTRVVDGSSNENEVGIALGEGSSGFIKRARWRGTLVAAKRVRVDSPSRAKSFIREVTCLSKLRHPHVLPFYGACLSPPNDCTIVARVCGGGTVKDWLYPRGDPDDMPPVVRAIRGTGVPPLQHRLCVARQIAAGMCHLEASGWAHRDLKPGNVFLVDKPSASVSRRSFKEPSKSESADGDPLPNENTGSDPGDLHGRYADVPTVVVADFGLARCVGDEDDEHDETSDENNKLKNLPPHWTGETGTYLYMAPEVVRSNGSTRRYGLSCDVWSFGVLLHELVAGVPPYRKQRKELLLSATQIALGVESGAVVLESFENDTTEFPAGVMAITKKCTEPDPADRPSFREVCDALDAMLPSLLKTLDAKETAKKNTKPLVDFWHNSGLAKSLRNIFAGEGRDGDGEKHSAEDDADVVVETTSIAQFLAEKKNPELEGPVEQGGK